MQSPSSRQTVPSGLFWLTTKTGPFQSSSVPSLIEDVRVVRRPRLWCPGCARNGPSARATPPAVLRLREFRWRCLLPPILPSPPCSCRLQSARASGASGRCGGCGGFVCLSIHGFTSPESAAFEATPDADRLCIGDSLDAAGLLPHHQLLDWPPSAGLVVFSKTCGQSPSVSPLSVSPLVIPPSHRFLEQTRPGRLERFQCLLRGFVCLVFRIGQNPLQTSNQRIHQVAAV